jgi:outer membrane protein
LTCSLPFSAFAAYPDAPKTDWNFTAGVGAIYVPAFVGSKDYYLLAVPDLEVKYKDRFFASMKDGVGYNIINSNGWRIGPVAKYTFERKENGDNPLRVTGNKTNALRGLGNVDGTLELGGFVEYAYDPLTAKVEVRQGVNGHKGAIVDVSLNYGGTYLKLGPPIIYSFGPCATFADSDYNNAYFGINQTQSTNSGLARYSAGGGLASYGVGAFALLPVTDSISVSTFAGYDRLGSKVTDSPLIKQRGSDNQFFTGMTVSYQFGY